MRLSHIKQGFAWIFKELCNATEVMPKAVSNKNYLFCGNHQADGRTAIIYSLMGSCKVNDVNPQEWLTDVLGRISNLQEKAVDTGIWFVLAKLQQHLCRKEHSSPPHVT